MESNDQSPTLAVLIDADNVSPSVAGRIFQIACHVGTPIVRRAYGMVNCFANPDGWQFAQRQYGILSKPQVSNVSQKNVADIALVIDAMEILYKNPCQGICIVSSDSDFTALAVKIREGGKLVYGIGGEKTPASFRAACTQFFVLPVHRKAAATARPQRMSQCPRCGAALVVSKTKSLLTCKTCSACGGMSMKLPDMRKSFAAETIASIEAMAQAHAVAGCICPDCGSSMSLVRVATGKKHVDIDVCGNCKTIWYDKDEFETLVPNDGVLQASISAGKVFRRELVMTLTADLRSNRLRAADIGALRTILKRVYHAPNPDVQPIIGTLVAQKVIKIDKQGLVTLVKS